MSAEPRLEGTPTAAGLEARADAIVTELLRLNERRWVALGERDRARVEVVARTIASRLLREPAAWLERTAGDGDATGYTRALRELFALDDEPVAEIGARGRLTRRRDACRRGPASEGIRALPS